ncbi:alpha/beta hydrolase [Paludibaculum fermentans]|uniref:alpha/beta hydrolase n=1 Tax=Paludibaculum fermentans TaxID=1473598 RepID=UPI003EBD0F96
MIRELTLSTRDGLRLYGWVRHPSGPIRGVITLIHGMGEHSRRYDHLTAFWAVNGYASAGFDHRGHGRSQGTRGHTPSLEHLLDDIADFTAQVADECPACPRYLYGHSMGGNLALNFLIRRQPGFTAGIASAPYLELAFQPSKAKLLLARLLYRILPAMTFPTGLDASCLSRDPAVVRRYREDPLVHDRISVSFFTEIQAAGQSALRRASELTLPVLLMHGNADRITSLAASERFVSGSHGRAAFKCWDGYFHELHNEPQWQPVAQFALDWLERAANHPLPAWPSE